MKHFLKYRSWILIWLWIGLVMVFVQIVIGGITRLTDSGLSITEWEVVKGVVPPMNEADWNVAFEKYKVGAKKQYESLHADMTLSEFKWIYFWEWFHRIWARTMGIVFIIPFIFFWMKKAYDRKLLTLLISVVVAAGSAGIFGWIMVQSGLGDDTRTWVSAYKLITHLFIAVITFGLIYWTILYVNNREGNTLRIQDFTFRPRYAMWILIIFGIQLFFGGMMAGMRAGLLHPHWPFFMHGEFFYQSLSNIESFRGDDLLNYEPSVFLKSWVQFFHRLFAYLLGGVILHFAYSFWRQIQVQTSREKYRYALDELKLTHIFSVILVLIQIILGILTVIYSIGKIPVVLGVIHQAMAILLLMAILKILFLHRNYANK